MPLIYSCALQRILASKDDEIIEYQQMLLNLREKMKMAQFDVDKNNVMVLQQVLFYAQVPVYELFIKHTTSLI